MMSKQKLLNKKPVAVKKTKAVSPSKMFEVASDALVELIDKKYTLEKMEYAQVDFPYILEGTIQAVKPNTYKEGRFQIVVPVDAKDTDVKDFFAEASIFPEEDQGKIISAFTSMQLRVYGPGAPTDDRMYDFTFSSGFRLVNRRFGNASLYLDLAPKDRFSEAFVGTSIYDGDNLENVLAADQLSALVDGKKVRITIHPRVWMMVSYDNGINVAKVGVKPVVDEIRVV